MGKDVEVMDKKCNNAKLWMCFGSGFDEAFSPVFRLSLGDRFKSTQPMRRLQVECCFLYISEF